MIIIDDIDAGITDYNRTIHLVRCGYARCRDETCILVEGAAFVVYTLICYNGSRQLGLVSCLALRKRI